MKAIDKDNKVVGQVTLSSDKIILRNKELVIKDQHGNMLLHANDDKFKIDIPNLNIIGKFIRNIEQQLRRYGRKSDEIL